MHIKLILQIRITISGKVLSKVSLPVSVLGPGGTVGAVGGWASALRAWTRAVPAAEVSSLLRCSSDARSSGRLPPHLEEAACLGDWDTPSVKELGPALNTEVAGVKLPPNSACLYPPQVAFCLGVFPVEGQLQA